MEGNPWRGSCSVGPRVRHLKGHRGDGAHASSPPPGLNAGAHSQQCPHPSGRHRGMRPRAAMGTRGPELGAGEERWSYGTRASRRAEAAMAHAPAAPRKPGTARAAQGPSGRQRDHPAATSARVHLRLASGRPAVSAFPPPTGWHGLRYLARRRGWGRPRGLTSAPSSWPGRGNRGLLLPGTRPRPGRGKAWTRPSAGSD